MSEPERPGWRKLRSEGRARGSAADCFSLDVEREVERTIAALSREELESFDLVAYREFLMGGSCIRPADPGFETKLRRDLWWDTVAGFNRDGIPQA